MNDSLLRQSANESRLIASLRRQRDWAIAGCIVLAGSLVASLCWGDDALNASLRNAAAHSVEYGGKPLYLSLYAIEPAERAKALDGIAFCAFQLSHGGVPISPVRVSDDCVMLDAAQYDPFNVGWLSAWQKIRDVRFALGDSYQYQFASGEAIAVSSVVVSGDRCSFVCNGKRYSDVPAKNLKQLSGAVAYPEWLDIGAAKLLRERTGYDMLDAREFAYAASYTALYNEFVANPKTLGEWRKLGGKFSAFGQAGARGWNADTSAVTGFPRAGERFNGEWITFDLDKSKEYTSNRDPFALPDRTAEFDAAEAFRLEHGGQFRTFIADGKGNRVDEVPPSVAIDYSHGVRALRVGLSCWSCHFTQNHNGVLPFQHSDGIPASKDYAKAAQLGAYYGDQDRLQRDAIRDQEDWREAIMRACDGKEPHVAVAALNWLVDQVSTEPVTPERACRELCLPVEDDAAATLKTWLHGVSNDALGQLAEGESVNYARFRLALPVALSHISHARRFAK